MHVEYTTVKLRGAKYKGNRIADVKPGSELELRREPDNIYDDDAVLVLGTVGEYESVPLGYLPKGAAARIARDMDAGREFKVVFAGGGVASTPYLVLLSAADGDELKLTKLKHR